MEKYSKILIVALLGLWACLLILGVGRVDYDEPSTIQDIPTPSGFSRIVVEANTFAAWLRNLALKPGDREVYLHNGLPKRNQTAHYCVIDLDVGTRDLQQCADAVIRLRAEYLFSQRAYTQIAFNFTSGDRAFWRRWVEGYRPVVRGNRVTWKQSAGRDDSYANFRTYLDTVFQYAGSYSLSRELEAVGEIADIRIGDVFIQGGFPGHAVLVVDLATSEAAGQIAILLAQSYMPAQDIHILRNPASNRNPWYIIRASERLYTPEWTFEWTDLKRFNENE